MSICLCNLSADVALELAARKGMELQLATPDSSSFVADVTLIAKVYESLGDKLPRPIELAVGDARRRRSLPGVSFHVWRDVKFGCSVLELDEGIYLTSPELTLLHQASQLHQASLCQMLGRYLGTWSPAYGGEAGLAERAPLTTVDSLRAMLAVAGGVRGKGNLTFALAHTCQGAASPAETTLQLALSLPYELHGMGLPLPVMNYVVDLSTESQALYPCKTIRIDLCWRDKGFGLEYQGEGHGEQLGDDYARWFAARNESYELWYLAKEQLANAVQMNYIGREIARRLEVSPEDALWPTIDELQNLLDTLAGRKHPKPVSYDELRRRQRAAKTHLKKCA